jgi:hypothetical protein
MVSLVCYVTAFARFGLRQQSKQQEAKSVNGPSFVCSLYSLLGFTFKGEILNPLKV